MSHPVQAPDRAWEWRKSEGGIFITIDSPGEPRFHAYDVNDNAACTPHWGLVASVEEPNEGSDLCPDCMVVVRENPAGRERRAGGIGGDRDG